MGFASFLVSLQSITYIMPMVEGRCSVDVFFPICCYKVEFFLFLAPYLLRQVSFVVYVIECFSQS